jgi:hypothetical protein
MRSAVQTVKDKKMGVSGRPTCASIAPDKQSEMNCDSKHFFI